MPGEPMEAHVPAAGRLAAGIRELRANVVIALSGVARPLIAVTSPHASEDRRHVAAQLAAALAQTGRGVLALDADTTPGAQVRASVDSADPIAGLTIVTAAAVSSGEPALLVAESFTRELRDYKRQFDVVVAACPPLLEVPEARAVAALSDGTLLVVQHGRSHRDDAVRAAAVLREAGARPLGAVIHEPG